MSRFERLGKASLLSIVAGMCCFASLGSAEQLSFERDIAPIFQQACGACHIATSQGNLRLDSEAAILRGGQSGPAISPGHSSDSLLVKRLLGLTDAPRMPLGAAPLSAEQIALIRRWINETSFDQTAAETAKPAVANTSNNISPVFAKEVRPILASRCYSCHGPDLQQNGLRLDSLTAILKGSDYGPVVVPHKSGQSRLVRRLLAQERPQMPYGGPPLSTTEIETIRKWIDAGAPGPDDSTPVAAAKPIRHWAYVKPIRPAIPEVKDSAWCRNPVDRFILARLEREGLKPSGEAERSALIRRLYLDLIGLPASPQELDAFLADTSPDAYENVVDHLLASPHYGERWAQKWLDLARYADSNGYEKDRIRTAWEYRDWVIRAFNSNMSFRDFTIDQIAGDMLPKPTHDQLIATGFNRNSMLNQEGGIDINEYYYYSLVDRVNTTASVWLGTTLGCAQCHNHKFDPFTQKDYYRFLAFFNNGEHEAVGNGDRWMQEPEVELPTPEQKKAEDDLKAQIATLKNKLNSETPDIVAGERAWETDLHRAAIAWTPLTYLRYQSAGGATLKVLSDGSILTSGANPQADTYRIEARTDTRSITGVRLEVLPDPSLPRGGPGRDAQGNFFLSDFDVDIASFSDPATQKIEWTSAFADESQEGYEIKRILTKEPGQLAGWSIDESETKPLERQGVFVPEKPFGEPGGTLLRITLKHQLRHASRNIGRFRISITSAGNPKFIVDIPGKLRPLLDTPEAQRTPEQQKDLIAAYREVSPLLDPTRKQIEVLETKLKKLGIATAMIMREEQSFVRPSAYIRERGTFTSPGELVYADVPTALNRLPADAMPNRLGLAEWLTSEDNPLTARVAVNHFWEAIFGRGIIETAEDFGTQGDPPSHPELLDWLATEFAQTGWDVKKMIRLIVTSATYRQDSRVTPELQARDPYNKLYAHGPRFRVDAETVHDIALAAGGLLSGKMYGPPVFPYQPEGIWDIPYSDDKWKESTGEDRYRRAIYTFIRRSAPYPSLITYDAPSREFCTIRRVRTDTPLQALTSLNDPFFFEAARAMAKRLLTEGGITTADRITYAFRLTVSRKPTKPELDRIEAFYNRQLAQYSRDAEATYKTITAAPASVPNAPELAAWTMVSNVLLNTDEALSKD